MAKKRTPNPGRARQFKYANPSAAVVAATPETKDGTTSTAQPAAAAALVTSDGRNFGYVSRDLRRIVMIGGTLLVIEIALRFVIN